MLNYGIATVVFGAIGYFGWKFTVRNAYESARYSVVRSEGEFEVRNYADLVLVSTTMQFDAQGNDGSFSRLFRYISGDNGQQQKVAMTTPVFMQRATQNLKGVTTTSEGEQANTNQQGQMAFVVPEEVASGGAPEPENSGVKLLEREGGNFAALRFPGRMGNISLKQKENELRQWLKRQNLAATGPVEYAGYDPPWTPGFLRRNEILIRID
jgi:hypothetical protein